MLQTTGLLKQITNSDLYTDLFRSELFYDVAGVKVLLQIDTQEFIIDDTITHGESVIFKTKDVVKFKEYMNNIFKHNIFDKDISITDILDFLLQNFELQTLYAVSYDIRIQCDIYDNDKWIYSLHKYSEQELKTIRTSYDINEIIGLYNIEIDKHNTSISNNIDFIDRIIYNNVLNIENKSIDTFYYETLNKYFENGNLIKIQNKIVYFDNELAYCFAFNSRKIYITEWFRKKLEYNGAFIESYIFGYIKHFNQNSDYINVDTLSVRLAEMLKTRLSELYL